jgi:hypothetical protein
LEHHGLALLGSVGTVWMLVLIICRKGSRNFAVDIFWDILKIFKKIFFEISKVRKNDTMQHSTMAGLKAM